MSAVKLPQMTLKATYYDETDENIDVDNIQVNPSMIHSYMGIRGVGTVEDADATKTRTFQALYLLAYWDTYKNYYSNKQEEIGARYKAGEICPALSASPAADGPPSGTKNKRSDRVSFFTDLIHQRL